MIKTSNFKLILILILLIFFNNSSFNIKYNKNLFRAFIKDCKNKKIYNHFNIINKKNTFLSICLPVYNMENYLEKALLSIINQSLNNFEIIIVNDNSKDNTEKIIHIYQQKFKNIRYIKHLKNLGVYKSRIDGALNAESQYILFMDPDDMLLNPFLFEELYNYNLKYNLDMIEFTVFFINEGDKFFFSPDNHELNHYHNFKKEIIYQPELSNILFYIPNTKNDTSLICRHIWNKLIKKTVLINSIQYIEKSFHNLYLIAADDTPLNILNFQLANNYSNIKMPGYLYNLRKESASRITNDNKTNIILGYNYLLYFRLFYKYLKDFKKNLNFLFYELRLFYELILILKNNEAKKYLSEAIIFLIQILKNKISIEFKNLIKEIIDKLKN